MWEMGETEVVSWSAKNVVVGVLRVKASTAQ